VPKNDREHFLKIAKEKIFTLHEGNFACFRLRPSEFKGWQYRKASWPPTSDLYQVLEIVDIFTSW